MMGPFTQVYLPFGDLNLVMEHGKICIGGVQYSREVFASYPDQCIVVRLRASKEGTLSFRARLDSPLRYVSSAESDQYILSGRAPEHVSPHGYDSEISIRYGDMETSNALKFQGRLTGVHEGGKMKVDSDGLQVIGATSATLYFNAATSFDPIMGVSSFGHDPEQILRTIPTDC